MSYVFEVESDGVIPNWLAHAYSDGEEIQILTSIGWVTFDPEDDIQFRNGNTYRIKP